MKCPQCKSNKGLIKNGLSRKGIQRFICNTCNTERVREYRGTPEGAMKIRQAVARSIKKHWGKHLARMKLYRAIKAGKVRKENCKLCGKTAEAHHTDYSKALSVVWLCRTHHSLEHNSH